RPRLHPTLQPLDRQRPLLPVADIERGPSSLLERGSPTVQSAEWAQGAAASAGVFRRWLVEVPDQGIRGDRQQVTLTAALQIPAKARRSAHLVVAGHPRVGQERALLVEHL